MLAAKQVEGRCQILIFKCYLSRWSKGDGPFRADLGTADAILATDASETQGTLTSLSAKVMRSAGQTWVQAQQPMHLSRSTTS